MNHFRTLAVAGLLALSLVACKREPAPEAVATDPAGAVEQLAKALRDNDLVRFNRISVPEELHEEARELWNANRVEGEPVDAEDDAQFRETMQRLTAPDAEERLYADLEPMLDQYDAEFAAQLPLAVAMGSAFANQAIQSNENLSAEQKQHAAEVLGALAGWVGTAPIGDRTKAREAIAVVTDSARRADVESMEAFRQLEHDEMLQRIAVAFEGGKDLLAIYGLDLDESLDSVDAKVVSETGDSATVRVSYRLLGSSIGFDMDMERIDGGWYSTDLVANAREQLAAEALAEDGSHDGDGDEEVVEEDDPEDGY